ncbi:MAG: zinc-dependent metalloprotease, partial [Candidatus Methylomirabilales bacterium]
MDARVAARFAARFAPAGPLDGSYLMDGLQEHLLELVSDSVPLVVEETGFEVVSPVTPKVLSRAEWATANVDPMLALLDPLLERAAQRPGGMGGVGRAVYGPMLGAQLGVVLGFLSQRVLGQYDVLMGGSGEVWFVGPNIVLTERRLGFVPRDFRLWVVLHELTHWAQFEGIPWLRNHFLSLVQGLLDSLDLGPRSWMTHLLEAVRNPDHGVPLGVRILDAAQRENFERIQAFMSVVEGHG